MVMLAGVPGSSRTVLTRLFQIWILPDARGAPPAWGAKPFPKGERSGRFVALASGIAGDADVLPIRADARLLGATLKAGESVDYPIDASRHAYLVPAKGSVTVNGVALAERGGAAITGETAIRVTAVEDSELVLVDAA